jgi:hypothetical protein
MANITTVNLTSGVPTGPAGPATVSTLDNLIGTTVAPCANLQTIQGNASGVAVPISGTLTANQGGAWTVSVSGTVTVSGTVSALQSGTWNITNVSGVVSLPTGAATSAKQPALGTGGTPSTDVITVQGISTGTALKVDGSGVTQPVSGTVGISGTVAATQSGTWNVGITGTPAVAQSGTWTNRIVGNAGSILDFNGQNQGSTSAVLTGGQFNTVPTTITSGNVSPLQMDSSANLLVNVKAGSVNSIPTRTSVSNSLTASRVVAAASTNATNLKASAGNIAALDVFNVATYPVFLKLYNKASAPTVGTDTPTWTIPVPAGGGFSRDFLYGEYFSTGISYAITKLQADSDTTAVAANDVTGRIAWV